VKSPIKLPGYESAQDASYYSNRGPTWWVIHACNKVARPDRGTGVALSRAATDSSSAIPDNLGEMAPVLEVLTRGIEVIDTVSREEVNLVVVPHVADDVREITSPEVCTLSDVHANT